MRAFIPYLLLAIMAVQAGLWAQLPVITNEPTGRALWTGGNVTFSAGISNASEFACQWLFNGTNLPNGIITTVAGNGTLGSTGDGGPAVNAKLDFPSSVAVDHYGNLFITEFHVANQVREVNTNGIIKTVAGTGRNSFGGDGGPATNAFLNGPFAIAVDAFGDLFIADRNNNRIREVDTNGIILTVAGNGAASFSGDGGAATNASLNNPQDVVVDGSGNVFIADGFSKRIREVNTNGIVTTVAGSGTNGFSGDGGPATNANLSLPVTGVALDSGGNLYIADFNNYRVRKIDTNGIITTVAGNGNPVYSGDGGAATNAGMYPERIAVDACGNLFIADNGNKRIREVNTNGIISTVAGNGPNYPNPDGAYSGDGGPATNASLYGPTDVTVDGFGNLFIAGFSNPRISKVINAQGPVLALNEATITNAGNYQLVVTGPSGSVTSSVVNLTVANSPLIYRTIANPSGVLLNFLSSPGSTNVVLFTTNLSSPVVWEPISTNLAGPDGEWQFNDTGTVDYPSGFYRSLTW